MDREKNDGYGISVALVSPDKSSFSLLGNLTLSTCKVFGRRVLRRTVSRILSRLLRVFLKRSVISPQ